MRTMKRFRFDVTNKKHRIASYVLIIAVSLPAGFAITYYGGLRAGMLAVGVAGIIGLAWALYG